MFPSIVLVLNCRTHNRRIHGQSEVSLKHYSCIGSHNTICSTLAQLILRKGHNYADSQAHLQAGPQAYQCLGWRGHEVVIRDVEPSVEKSFRDNFWSELVGETT